MLVQDLEQLLEMLAPAALAEPWDNTGLLVGERGSRADRILLSLELTEPVLAEALAGGFQAVVTHHPLLFKPLARVTERTARERIVRGLVKNGVALLACHTNLDAAPGGFADILADALGLHDLEPVVTSPAGWSKFVGFVPQDALERVSAAVFAAGAGIIGDYADCAFAAHGEGWFTAGERAHPAVGTVARAERVPEVRWETVVPRGRVGAAAGAYLRSHPYEEPAFDVYPLDDVLGRIGLGRVGVLSPGRPLGDLAAALSRLLSLDRIRYSGDSARIVERVACLPGSGGSLIEQAARVADALVTGDLGYHDAEEAADLGLSLVDVPHEIVEDWAFRRWSMVLRSRAEKMGAEVALSESWRSSWQQAGHAEPIAVNAEKQGVPVRTTSENQVDSVIPGTFVLRVDGGSRGNPGPSAIGVVLENGQGEIVERVGRTIGVTTNNVAEYSALIFGLRLAQSNGVQNLEICSDSELLVKQLKGEYKVRSAGLKDLYEEAVSLMREFSAARIRHVVREENKLADNLVNEALDSEKGSRG